MSRDCVFGPSRSKQDEYFSQCVITTPNQPPLAADTTSSALDAARAYVQTDLVAAVGHLEQVAGSAPGEIPQRLSALMGRHGKRVRSTLLLLFSRMGDVRAYESAQLGAAAVELLHTASLAHDDVIDEAEMRRGEPSAPSRWGNKMAVLVGDYAFARSMELAIASGNPEVVRAINHASCELVAGEIAEFDFAQVPDPTWAGYRQVIYSKTAVLLEVCCQAGSLFSGLSSEQVNAAKSVGGAFGMAFQMCDDLLDLDFSGTLDKPAHIDLQNGLLSLPSLLEREMNGGDLRDWLAKGPMELFAHLRDTGVLKRALELIQAELDIASRHLELFPVGDARTHVTSLIDDLRMRTLFAMG
jgi:heptaprenyl diphosphate synthase